MSDCFVFAVLVVVLLSWLIVLSFRLSILRIDSDADCCSISVGVVLLLPSSSLLS